MKFHDQNQQTTKELFTSTIAKYKNSSHLTMWCGAIFKFRTVRPLYPKNNQQRSSIFHLVQSRPSASKQNRPTLSRKLLVSAVDLHTHITLRTLYHYHERKRKKKQVSELSLIKCVTCVSNKKITPKPIRLFGTDFIFEERKFRKEKMVLLVRSSDTEDTVSYIIYFVWFSAFYRVYVKS